MGIKHGYHRQIQEKSCAEQLREPTPSHPPVLMVPLKAVTVKLKRKALEMKVAELEANLKRKENEEADKRKAFEMIVSELVAKLKRKENEEAGKRKALRMKVAELEAKLKLKENEVRRLYSDFGHEPRPAVHFLDPTPARAPSPGVPLPQYEYYEELSHFHCLNIRSAGSGGSWRSREI